VLVDADGAARPAVRLAGAEELATLLRTEAPTLGAVPPGHLDRGPIHDLIEDAKRAAGAGLDVHQSPGVEAEGLARAVQDANRIRPTWVPDPREAVTALVEMVASGEMLRHIVASVFRVASGFTAAAWLGIPLGLALGSFAVLSAALNGVIQTLRPISPIAWLPAATLVLGGGDLAAVFLIFLASFFPIVISTAAAVATVDLKYRRSAQNFGVEGIALARHVILPAVLPSILTALRVAVGISWVVVVAAEMLGVESGLGFLVLDARNQLRYDRVVAAMIVIGLIGLAIDSTVRRFERAELERRGLRAA
jgi:NitT/TauT family transport system permease protein